MPKPWASPWISRIVYLSHAKDIINIEMYPGRRNHKCCPTHIGILASAWKISCPTQVFSLFNGKWAVHGFKTLCSDGRSMQKVGLKYSDPNRKCIMY